MTSASDEVLEGLPVKGYKAQSEDAVTVVNGLKVIEEQVLRLLDNVTVDPRLAADRRWLAIARTNIEQGFMAAVRSIFKPGRADIDVAPAVSESGWLIVRADSPVDAPLYFCPVSHGSQWTDDDGIALHLSRSEDAERLAGALGVETRVVELLWD